MCTHPKKGGSWVHTCWLVLDEPTADAAQVLHKPTVYGSLFHVQPEYYSVNHCPYVVDPANLATIPNASLGSMKQGELWPSGLQATPGTPAVVKGVFCADTLARGITHCTTHHSVALGTDQLGLFKCMAAVGISPAIVNAGRVVITRM
jgi:hypothetical protein